MTSRDIMLICVGFALVWGYAITSNSRAAPPVANTNIYILSSGGSECIISVSPGSLPILTQIGVTTWMDACDETPETLR